LKKTSSIKGLGLFVVFVVLVLAKDFYFLHTIRTSIYYYLWYLILLKLQYSIKPIIPTFLGVVLVVVFV